MDRAKALKKFWSSYGLEAFDNATVPDADDAPEFPYITFEEIEASFDEPVLLSGNIWDRSSSWSRVTEVADEIYDDLGRGGKIVVSGSESVWIKRGNPFSQRMADDDDSIRRIYINIEVEYISSV